jgi:hypothetical protein
MTLISLQALTWTTVAGAVVGALLLASSASAEADKARPRPAPRAHAATHHTPLSAHLPRKADAGPALPVTQKNVDLSSR